MAKRPENMTPDERLARIRSLERKVNDLEHRLAWAEREREGTYEWAHSAFRENRRLTDRLRELIERIPSIIQPDRGFATPPTTSSGGPQDSTALGGKPMTTKGANDVS